MKWPVYFLYSQLQSGNRTETFVSKQGRVFASVEVPAAFGAETRGWYHLATCPGNMRCQVLIRRRTKKGQRERGQKKVA